VVDRRRFDGAFTQDVCDGLPDTARTHGFVVHAPFEHAQRHIIVPNDEAAGFGSLLVR
jgi:hypothetical protein